MWHRSQLKHKHVSWLLLLIGKTCYVLAGLAEGFIWGVRDVGDELPCLSPSSAPHPTISKRASWSSPGLTGRWWRPPWAKPTSPVPRERDSFHKHDVERVYFSIGVQQFVIKPQPVLSVGERQATASCLQPVFCFCYLLCFTLMLGEPLDLGQHQTSWTRSVAGSSSGSPHAEQNWIGLRGQGGHREEEEEEEERQEPWAAAAAGSPTSEDEV